MHWLIDGHNLIGHMPNLRLDDPHDEEKLLTHLRSFRARTGHRLTVIFDAGLGYRPAQTRKQGGITVQFAPAGKTADQLLARRIRRLPNPQAVTVVTSDRAVQQAARHAGARVQESADFARQLLQNPAAPAITDQGAQAEVNLSPEEIDDWLTLFDQTD